LSKRDAALAILVDMLDSGEDRDRVSAADKILRSDNIDRPTLDNALNTLAKIMEDRTAKPGDRVNAADKLRTHAGKTSTPQSLARRLAALTDEELHAIVDEYQIPRRLEVAVDELLQ
jgi:hypothetical protein